MNKKQRVVIIGCGLVGTTVAHTLIVQGICDEIIFITTNQYKAEGEVLDLLGGMTYLEKEIIVRVGEYSDCKDADVILFTAGSPPSEGEDRIDNWGKTKKICDAVVAPIMEQGFCGIFLVVSNPVDLVTNYILQISGLPRQKVIGTGTGVDTSRLKYRLKDKFYGLSKDVKAYCLGEHGDSMTIPWSQLDFMLRDKMSEEEKQSITELVKNEGWEICARKQKTCYGIAITSAAIMKAIFRNTKEEMVVSTYLSGEYGVEGICMGVPVIIDQTGVSYIVELELKNQELIELKNSAQIILGYY